MSLILASGARGCIGDRGAQVFGNSVSRTSIRWAQLFLTRTLPCVTVARGVIEVFPDGSEEVVGISNDPCSTRLEIIRHLLLIMESPDALEVWSVLPPIEFDRNLRGVEGQGIDADR